MVPEQFGDVYFCYGNPRPGGRTGHGAVLVMKPGIKLDGDNINDLTDDQVAYYYSLYPDVKPGVIAGASKSDLVSKSFPAYCVTSAVADIQMRGRSGLIMMQALADRKKQKRLEALATELEARAEDPANADTAKDLLLQAGQYRRDAKKIKPEFETGDLTELMADMPQHTEQGADYFAAGQFDALVKMPVKSGEVHKLVRYLKFTETNIEWKMFGQGSSPIADQNCCSAFVCGLGLAGVNVKPRKGYTPVSQHVDDKAKLVAWTAYFTLLLMQRNDVFSMEMDSSKLLLLPLAYAGVRFGMAMKHVNSFYKAVLPTMSKTPDNPGLKMQLGLRALISVLNASLCLISTNPAVDKIIAPKQLFETLKQLPGAEVIDVNKRPARAQQLVRTVG